MLESNIPVNHFLHCSPIFKPGSNPCPLPDRAAEWSSKTPVQTDLVPATIEIAPVKKSPASGCEPQPPANSALW
jgi:hypothetical protein